MVTTHLKNNIFQTPKILIFNRAMTLGDGCKTFLVHLVMCKCVNMNSREFLHYVWFEEKKPVFRFLSICFHYDGIREQG